MQKLESIPLVVMGSFNNLYFSNKTRESILLLKMHSDLQESKLHLAASCVEDKIGRK